MTGIERNFKHLNPLFYTVRLPIWFKITTSHTLRKKRQVNILYLFPHSHI